MYPEHHDFEHKVILDDFVLPAREPSQENAILDIDQSLAYLFNHPNTPVFISKQLIQFFMTANPSPDYVERIHDVFVDNGSGERGDLGAVIKAILLDPEAREMAYAKDPAFGKLKEPVIRTMAMGRILGVGQDNKNFTWWNNVSSYADLAGQGPHQAPSVFNFYRPDYQNPGVIRDNGLVSPVFEVLDSNTAISLPNLIWEYVNHGLITNNRGYFAPFNYKEVVDAAIDDVGLINHLDLLICAGEMSQQTRQVLIDLLSNSDLTDSERVLLATYLVITSADGSIQR